MGDRHTLVYFTTIATHFPCLYYIYVLTNPLHKALMTSVFVFSTLMHVSETKHGLPGLCLTKWSRLLLNLDRASSVCTILYLIYTLWSYDMLYSRVIGEGISILIFNALSENLFIHNWLWYSLMHGIWHVLAFDFLGRLLFLIY